MLTVNSLANVLPLNGYTTGELSAMYPNLFVPANYTFSIWLVIYLLLTLFIIYQTGWFFSDKSAGSYTNRTIGVFFILSSLANALWILAWHYLQVLSSLVLMFVLLISLLIIYFRIYDKAMFSSGGGYLCVKLPVSVYLAWVGAALFANISAVLSYYGKLSSHFYSETWTVFAIGMILIIEIVFMRKFKDYIHTLIVVWVYFGILHKHIFVFNQAHDIIMILVVFSIAVLIVLTVKTYLTEKRSVRSRRSV